MLVKYPNRRIYDTELHRYFTIPHLRERLLKGERVQCKTTGGDVTAEVLLQLLTHDLKQGHGPAAEALRRLIQEYSAKV